MSNSTERYNNYIEQLAREDIREAEIKYQENVAELAEAVWLRVGEVLAGLDHDDVSITAREKIAKAICAATGKEKP
jgi:NADH pyrophosphatase NudC (nudix superfamily)